MDPRAVDAFLVSGYVPHDLPALRHVRDDMGLTNVWVMIPFVRTLKEAEGVIALLARNGLVRALMLDIRCSVARFEGSSRSAQSACCRASSSSPRRC